jgi:hypothetical protein
MQHNINICCPHVSGRPKSRILILKGIQTIFKAKIAINCQSREQHILSSKYLMPLPFDFEKLEGNENENKTNKMEMR